jgi:16S rRNA (guanine527-N7)-methyltransferase
LTVPVDFAERASAIGVSFEAGDTARLDRFLTMMLERNTQFNITGIRDETVAWERHILDSLTLMGLIANHEAAHVADVGSGGGLPGIPLAICLPEVRFTLIESTGKKARFLEDVVMDLSLGNVKVICDRAETLGRVGSASRARSDIVLARAVGPLAVTLELTVALARVGGLVAIIKGEKADEELALAGRAMSELRVAHLETVGTPTGRVVVFEKVGETPRKYPRLPGEPKKSPLV